MRIEPYPDSWPRRLDFLPSLLLQARIDGPLELFYCKAHVTSSDNLGTEPIKTEYGTIQKGHVAGEHTQFITGSSNPRKEIEPITQREILDDIQAFLPDAGATIATRGTYEPLPDRLRKDIPALETSEHILRLESGSGIFSKMLSRRLSMRLFNPYQHMKAELLDRGLIKAPHDPVLKQLRSALKTDYILPEDEQKSYYDISEKVVSVDAGLSASKWWETIGYPVPFEGTVDHTLVKGRVFHLPKYESFVVV